MHELFYAYASSSKDKAKIDESLIRQALDWWTWAWIALESASVLLTGSIIAYLSSLYKLAYEILGVSLVLILFFYFVVRLLLYKISQR